MVLLSVAMIGMGAAFGTVEVAVAAFASQHGARSLTGVVLAAFAIGSGAGRAAVRAAAVDRRRCRNGSCSSRSS